MRKQKVIEYNGKSLIIKELTVQQIYDLGNEIALLPQAKAYQDFVPFLRKWTPILIDGFSDADFWASAPSELKEIKNALLEVNADFFETVNWLGLRDAVMAQIEQIRKGWMKSSAD